jgi:hypothetical protein
MNLSRKLFFLVAAMAIFCASTGEANAQVGGAPPFLGYGFFGNGLYGSIGWQTPPYYALFPPVYYSFPVPRPYGYSPFAYPPGYVTPTIEPVQAKQIINPFVPRKEVSPASDRTTAAPKVIVNPFVVRRSAPELAARSQIDAGDTARGLNE